MSVGNRPASTNRSSMRTPRIAAAKTSQETLAEMIGTTRPRVSFFMNKFRQLGFIDYNSGIAVHRSLLNAVLHDQPQIKI
jgi:CRP/FNR family cyclic AMP-dependent transcriptional regulator